MSVIWLDFAQYEIDQSLHDGLIERLKEIMFTLFQDVKPGVSKAGKSAKKLGIKVERIAE